MKPILFLLLMGANALLWQGSVYAQDGGDLPDVLADIQYELDTCPLVRHQKWLDWSCFGKQEARLVALAHRGEGRPNSVEIEAARLLAQYRQRQHHAHRSALPDPVPIIACLRTRDQVVVLTETDFEMVVVGMAFGEGFVAGLDSHSLWFQDDAGLRSLALVGVPPTEQTVPEDAAFVLCAAGAERPILKLLGELLGLTLSGDIGERRLEGVWYGRSEAELFYNLLESRGYRFMQDGKMVVFPARNQSEAETFAKIIGLRRQKFLRRLRFPQNLQPWQIQIADDVLLSQDILDLVRDDDFDIHFVLQTLADKEGLCYLFYRGNYHVDHCTEITRRQRSHHGRLVAVIQEKFFNSKSIKSDFSKRQLRQLEILFEKDYQLAHYFGWCIDSIDRYPIDVYKKLVERIEYMLHRATGEEQEVLRQFKKQVAETAAELHQLNQ